MVSFISNKSFQKAVEALPEFYQPIYGHKEWDNKPLRNCEDLLSDIEKVYEHLSNELKRPLRVLDLGCAQGFFSFNIAHKGGGSYRCRFSCSKHRHLQYFGA